MKNEIIEVLERIGWIKTLNKYQLSKYQSLKKRMLSDDEVDKHD
jgi:hypothetical protein